MTRRALASALAGLAVAGPVAVLAVVALRDDGASPAGRPANLPAVRIGVVANALDDDAPRMARRVRAAGVRWMREEFRWGELEPEEGAFSFERYDRMVAALAAQGIHVLPVLNDSPGWLDEEPNHLPRSLAKWQAFVGRVVGRYGEGGTFWAGHPELDAGLAPTTWEVWNEPYLRQFSRPAPDPARYAELVKATAIAGRRSDPGSRYLAAVETTYEAANGTVRRWAHDVFAAEPDLADYAGGLAVHPYAPGPPTSAAIPRVQRFGRISDIQRDLAQLGVAPRPTWITELGWSTCTSREDCFTETQQGAYLATALDLATATPAWRVEAVFVYRFDDLRGSAADPQSRFGLIRLDGTHKPAYDVVREAARAAG